VNARGKRWTRNAIAQHVIPPVLKEANRQRANAGLCAIREEVTSHTLRYTCIASLFAAGADQEYLADQVGHEDVTTTRMARPGLESVRTTSPVMVAGCPSPVRHGETRTRIGPDDVPGHGGWMPVTGEAWRDPDSNRGHHDFQSCCACV
jgi:Phage integrase family